MRRRSRRRRSRLLAVFGGTGQFRHRRGSVIVGVVMPVRRHALVLPMDWAGVSRVVFDARWFDFVFAVSSWENFEGEFEVEVVAIEP